MATVEQVREHYHSLAFVYRTYWGDHIHHGLFESGNESAEAAGLTITHCEDRTAKIIRTWEICQGHARLASPIVKLLPQAAREFVGGIDTILDAYRSGDLTYTVLVARK
jgi:hypothetical protein